MAARVSRRRMVYWSSRAEAGPQAAVQKFASRMERYAERRIKRYVTRRALRMGLAELGAPMAVAGPIAATIMPAIELYIQYQVALQLKREMDRFERRREAMMRQVYKGIVPE